MKKKKSVHRDQAVRDQAVHDLLVRVEFLEQSVAQLLVIIREAVTRIEKEKT